MIDRYTYYYRKGKIKTTERFLTTTPNLVSVWLEKVRRNPYFNDFDCYLFGSLIYKDKADDMDIFYTGEYLPEILVDLMDYSIQVAFDLNINIDVMFIPDFSYLKYPPNFTSNKRYDIYTSYDHEMMVERGKLVLFRDYGVRMADGLFKSLHSQYHKKSVERGVKQGDRLKKLN